MALAAERKNLLGLIARPGGGMTFPSDEPAGLTVAPSIEDAAKADFQKPLCRCGEQLTPWSGGREDSIVEFRSQQLKMNDVHP